MASTYAASGNVLSSYFNFMLQSLTGLDTDDAMIPYMHYFLNEGIDGRKLLLMTHADLEKLNVVKLGHQELILEAIDLLRNFVSIIKLNV